MKFFNKLIALLLLLLVGVTSVQAQISFNGDDQYIVHQTATGDQHLGTSGTGAVKVDTSDLELTASGKSLALEDDTAASACVGGAVAATGTTAVVVSTTCVSTGDYVLLTRESAPSGTAQCFADPAQIIDGASFELDCDGAETGTFKWLIIKQL